jgi:uncharacterized protein YciI
VTFTVVEVWSLAIGSVLVWCVFFYVGRCVGTHNATREEQRLRHEAKLDRMAAEEHLAAATRNLDEAKKNLEIRREEIEKEVSDRCEQELQREISLQQSRAEVAVSQAVLTRIQAQQRRIEEFADYEFRGELVAADVLLQFRRETGDQETREADFGDLYARMRREGFKPLLRITAGEDTDRIEITQHIVAADGAPREICIAYMRRGRARLGNVLEHMFPYQPRRRTNIPDAPAVAGVPIVRDQQHSRNIEL